MPRTFSPAARLRSFRYAFRGIGSMLATQHNAWLHAGATVGVFGLAAGLGLSRVEWCIVVAAVVGVWVAEAINTAFEFLCDVASPEFHPLVERAKDVAAGAVLLAAIGAAAIGMILFIPAFFRLLDT